jgi:hypothetical protein
LGPLQLRVVRRDASGQRDRRPVVLKGRLEMNRFWILAILLLLPVSASAEWRVVFQSNAGTVHYYDPTRVLSDPPYRTAWIKSTFVAPRTLADGKQYRSAVQKIVVNCRTEEIAISFSEYFEGANAAEPPFSKVMRPKENWEFVPAAPDSEEDFFRSVVCSAAQKP